MRKADVVLAVLAAVALAATAVAGLSGDRWTSERTLRFSSSSVPLPPSDLLPAGGGGARFNWTVPDNATSANLTVTLYFEGQAFQGGNAVVSVRIATPDGKAAPPATRSWTIPQGATSGEFSLEAGAAWDEAPSAVRDTTDEGHARVWTRPLEVVVSVERPSDVPLASYGFTASVTGTLSVFEAA